jgi:hypothetical protein
MTSGAGSSTLHMQTLLAENRNSSSVFLWVCSVRGFGSASAVCDLCALCDNQACEKIVRNPIYSAESKHTDIQHHFVREREAEGDVRIRHCAATQDMVADVMTEPVARAVLSGLCGTRGVC